MSTTDVSQGTGGDASVPAMRITTTPPLGRRALALLDGAAIVAFAAIGLASHNGTVSGRGLVRDAVPLLIGWTIAALVFRPYRKRTLVALGATWAGGIPLGVLIRGIVLGRSPDGKQLAFLLTTLVFTSVLIAAVRVAAGALAMHE
jgi:Protein of unknown function (DUF3054)